jgi:uncharacterized protein YndB with AHSA1/START domain
MNQTIYKKDTANKKMDVSREFAADVETTWKAWTDPALLDQWWAPHPWKAKTKSMNFKEGGRWLYCMMGPDGSVHWARADYRTIVAPKYFIADDCFCDENGVKNDQMPSMTWKVQFESSGAGTKVQVEITFASEKDLQQIIDTGFEEGFRMAHGNLDELLKKLEK